MNDTQHRPGTEMFPALLAERAQRAGSDICLIEAETDHSVTFHELNEDARRLAQGLRGLGVGAGDTVATMLPHSVDTYRIWFGLTHLAALEVPIGTKYRGRMLKHILQDSGARVLIVDEAHLAELAPVLGDGDLPTLATVIVRGAGTAEVPGGFDVRSLDDLRKAADVEPLPEREAVAPHDLAMVLYTSGTTGPSKGVLIPWGQIHATTLGAFPDGTFEPGMVIYGPFPPNHVGGRLFPCLGILHGVPVVLRNTFSASAFWVDIQKYRCTTTALVSAMASILWNTPVNEHEADNPLHDVLMVPLIAEYDRFQQRFGVRVCTDYNMTETSIPLHSGWDFEDWRSCGRVRPGYPGYELRIVDADDNPLGPGEVGELVCRTDAPWTLNAGYLGRPDATAEAWRNGWFHTGDAFRYDEQGQFYFVDRTKDAIRRRGENVSSFEVEREVLDHPDVIDCAAIGVPSELSEEDIKVFVVKRPGSELTEALLAEHVREKAASFMVPQYIEFLDALPVTEATNKVKKSELRALEAQRREQASSLTASGSAG
ncbi:AMP-binding protein [Streptomyces sp. JH14]|uniref:AMP-binding protein n=1 Tax=Streptomyces sp. JH14 TaxID=2793630 RepID=UPI0023F9CD6D|nr:AMP-binding protein [Streptomyces sp. JH14]MDF6046143.1 AMP-binding protein [Streptomyces sp. JH14]